MTHKTTVYLPDELKIAVKRLARQRGSSEAEVIRRAIRDAARGVSPSPGFLDGEPLAERSEELLDGFGFGTR